MTPPTPPDGKTVWFRNVVGALIVGGSILGAIKDSGSDWVYLATGILGGILIDADGIVAGIKAWRSKGDSAP